MGKIGIFYVEMNFKTRENNISDELFKALKYRTLSFRNRRIVEERMANMLVFKTSDPFNDMPDEDGISNLDRSYA